MPILLKDSFDLAIRSGELLLSFQIIIQKQTYVGLRQQASLHNYTQGAQNAAHIMGNCQELVNSRGSIIIIDRMGWGLAKGMVQTKSGSN